MLACRLSIAVSLQPLSPPGSYTAGLRGTKKVCVVLLLRLTDVHCAPRICWTHRVSCRVRMSGRRIATPWWIGEQLFPPGEWSQP